MSKHTKLYKRAESAFTVLGSCGNSEARVVHDLHTALRKAERQLAEAEEKLAKAQADYGQLLTEAVALRQRTETLLHLHPADTP